LLGEVFIEALNDPEAIDTKRLRAFNQLAQTLLKAVGTPPTFLVHRDRRDPPASVDHLLRVYPPLSPEVEALLAAEPPMDEKEATLAPVPPTGEEPPKANRTTGGDRRTTRTEAVSCPPPEVEVPAAASPGDHRASEHGTAVQSCAPAGRREDHVVLSQAPVSLALTPQAGSPEQQQVAKQTQEQVVEQTVNRSRTGRPGTNDLLRPSPSPLLLGEDPGQRLEKQVSPSFSGEGPAPRSQKQVSPPLSEEGTRQGVEKHVPPLLSGEGAGGGVPLRGGSSPACVQWNGTGTRHSRRGRDPPSCLCKERT
jgi:hypothetical protein